MINATAMRSAAVLRTVVRALTTLGADTPALLAQAGVDTASFEDDTVFLPVELHNRVWDVAATQMQDDLIGMRVAGLISLDVHEVLGGVVQSSATLGDAIVRMSRFGALLGADFEISLEVRGEHAIVRAPRHGGTELQLQGALCQLATYGILGHKLTGMPLAPTEIRCIHPRPAFADALPRIFRAPVTFDASHNAIVFESRLLHAPVLGHDPSRCESLEAEAELQLDRLSRAPSMVRAVDGMLSLGLGTDGLRQLAALLNLNERTVTRKLAAEGTSYAKLRDSVRQRRAREYLAGTRLPIHDIGIMLGFSDGTAFTRAFRRWTGRTPRSYRTAAAVARDVA